MRGGSFLLLPRHAAVLDGAQDFQPAAVVYIIVDACGDNKENKLGDCWKKK